MAADDPFSHIIGRTRRGPQETAARSAKPAPAEPPDAEAAKDPRAYQAFETEQHPQVLDIRCAKGPCHSPSYGPLLNIIYDGRHWGSFVLIFSFMTVTVRGRHLAPVIHALRARHCASITEFDRRAFDAPAHDAPVIEAIAIQAGKVVSAASGDVEAT